MMFSKTCVKTPPQLQPQRFYLSGGMFSFFTSCLLLLPGSRSDDSCIGGDGYNTHHLPSFLQEGSPELMCTFISLE